MELYVHSVGSEEPELIKVEATLLIRELVADRDGEEVWIEEQDEALDLDITLEEAGLENRHHVHRGRCKRVEVSIRYGGQVTHSHIFPPSTTIERVFNWATGPEGYDLTPEERVKHMLIVPGADHALDKTVHLGSLLQDNKCEICLDLAPKERFEG